MCWCAGKNQGKINRIWVDIETWAARIACSCLLVLWFSEEDNVANTEKLACVPVYSDGNCTNRCTIRPGVESYRGWQQRGCHPASACLLSLAVACCMASQSVPDTTRHLASAWYLFGRLQGIGELSDRVFEQLTPICPRSGRLLSAISKSVSEWKIRATIL